MQMLSKILKLPWYPKTPGAKYNQVEEANYLASLFGLKKKTKKKPYIFVSLYIKDLFA